MRYLVPVSLIVGLLVLLGIGLRLDPTEVPSPLIGKLAPPFDLPTLEDDGRVTSDVLLGQPTLVNFFASWCTPCLAEHPLFMRLSAGGSVRIVGISYKDRPEDTSRWLARHGNPFALVARDAVGASAIDWGVYGVPESYLLDAEGRIVHKHVGPISDADWRGTFEPKLRDLARLTP
ncbi:MAG: DsbE family thiol:disulfide interchange protein [Polycyclovorans sp.]|jgi:cytochrome c biogenesis protein CcmG/thiol:disulfide interchange protein DsbE|nr:DsbE family thiol:disulfide interchange protein [Polycyclovorans sp.]MDP1542117.1 DsbE family thiol:disulfide interchange protein [Polycyclovorans sp.]MEC8848700.1 DsbE family thiol:disulfide interchange protein [Pseudomonadota bacterium]|tara:strand:+ start:51478 stop:52005 length:528 start_codon:yes stop_codon:yes gene_type:complete